jgi:hypothetical protein
LPDQDPYPYQTNGKPNYIFFPEKISIYCPNIENYDTYDADEKDKIM